MAKALISGITGFVGSHLAEYLISNTDWDIVGLCRWRSPLENIKNLVPLINSGNRVKLLYADLSDSVAVQRAVKIADADYIFHLAAQSYPQTSFYSAIDTLDTNIQGTVRLLEAILDIQQGHPLIHMCSSSEVYGRAKTIPINESAPFHPASPYAVSKVGADLMARYYAEAHGMNIQITRMFTHTGPRRGDVFFESSFAKQIAMIEAGQIDPVIKVGNLESMRTICDVRDAVRAYYLLLTVKPQPGEVYNIGGNHSCTVGDVLNTLLSLSTKKITVQQDPDRIRPIDADLQIPDCSKFKQRTGWEPLIPYEKTMQDLLSYWRERVMTVQVLQR